jgi:hypothetical protein
MRRVLPFVRRFAAIGLIFAGGAGAGCTLVNVAHDPIYRAETHTSTITARARNYEAGVSSITIYVTVGTMTTCAGGLPGLIPCRINATATEHTCSYAGAPADATCQTAVAVPDEGLISYRVTARPVVGWNVDTAEVAFAGGAPPPVRLARPMYWHIYQQMPKNIDIGFFPDADYTSYRAFTDDVDTIVDGAFFNETQVLSRRYSFYIEAFNLWAGPFGADAEARDCTREYVGEADRISAAVDVGVILHTREFRDCSSWGPGGAASGGSVQTSVADPVSLFVHESGHFLFGLSDEYCCDGGYDPGQACPTVYVTQQACEAAAPSAGASPNQCSIINTATGADVWRIGTALETMDNQGPMTNFRDDGGRCVEGLLKSCSTGGPCL